MAKLLDISPKTRAMMEKHGVTEKYIINQGRGLVRDWRKLYYQGCLVKEMISELNDCPSDGILGEDHYGDYGVAYQRDETDDEWASRVCRSVINKNNANKQKASKQSKEKALYERLKKKYE